MRLKNILKLFLLSLATSLLSLLFLNIIFQEENSLALKVKPTVVKKEQKLVTNKDQLTDQVIAKKEQKQTPKKAKVKKPTKILKKKKQKPVINQDQITYKYITVDQVIPFTTKTIYDNTLYQGNTVVQQAGINGLKRLSYTIHYKNGVEIQRDLNNTAIIKQPREKIIKIGTLTISGGQFNDVQARALLTYVNQERAKVGLPALYWNNSLFSYAKIRAKEISIVPDHVRPNEQPYNSLNPSLINGENLIVGSHRPLTAQEAMVMWMNSPGHKANILRPQFKSMAGAYYITQNGTYRHHWIQLFSVN